MAGYAAMEDMDAKFKNPSKTKNADYVYSQPMNGSGDLIPIFLSDEVLTIRTGRKSVESTGRTHKLNADSIFAHGYASEEEAASPVEDNDFGFNSTDETESSPSIRESESLEDLSKDYHSVQLCTAARAIRFVSAGKARVVSLPEMNDTSPTRSHAGPVDEAAIGTAISQPARVAPVAKYAYERSPRSSTDKSPAGSSFEEPIIRPRTIRRKPKLPPLRAVTGSSASRSIRNQTPLAEQRAEFPSFSASEAPASVSPTKRTIAKLSPSFSLKPFGRSRRSDSSASSSTDGGEGRIDWWNVPSSSSSSTTGYPVTRNFSRPATKPVARMVPRGANERAPPLVLPPFPDDFDDGWDVDYPTQWPVRKDSVTSPPDSESLSALKHIRRKSLSAAFATTQA